ncbi:hypothetical protein HHO41_08970 [Bacillus sp. DNRA2]|uniref:hypothetical protein n=1 Tax=Bacillus sp. DNRA2 TaxID=2723053 RepID=UPI00145ECF83|nr:hypothetical protein [Bacillus sp. DNRA2]NMD70425.1 hypothetical protein [Bacillus sp. DNRA2]
MGEDNERLNNEGPTFEKWSKQRMISSGPIEATPNTEIISVNIINVDPVQPRDIIVEIKNWTTCPPTELGKIILLCGEQVNPNDIGYQQDEGVQGFDPTIHPFEEEDDIPALTKPLVFKLPPQMQLTVLADFPQPLLLPSNPCYEVRISLINTSNMLISSFGLNDEFEPQVGNTVLHHQFFTLNPIMIESPENPGSTNNQDFGNKKTE